MGGEGVKEVQLVDINLGTLGCSFLGRSLGPHLDENQKLTSGNINVQCLVLDYNQIGSEGMEQLALGLAQNSYLQRLDLNYCGIDSKAAASSSRSSSTSTATWSSFTFGVTTWRKRACSRSFGEDKDTIDALISLFTTNTSITNYDLVGNYITDVGAEKLIQGILGSSHLKDIRIPEQCSEAALTRWRGPSAREAAARRARKARRRSRRRYSTANDGRLPEQLVNARRTRGREVADLSLA